MLEAKDLSKTYQGKTALDNLNLKIESGEVFCLLGANGAGKTTTINLFLGFTQPSSGTAYIDGFSVAEQPQETKKFLAYIPEQVMLYRHLTGIENLSYFSALGGHDNLSTPELRDYLRRAGLQDDAMDKRISGYSKGMRQKVGIAVALAKGARVLLLDEPTSGLDPKASNEFSVLLKQMSDAGTAILMATHDLFRAKEAGNRVGLMRQGKLLSTFSTEDVSHTQLEQIYLEQMSH
ncbi:ABC transporter ATP-binding protein [bacterium]|nr:MAG: ABC transporter ATP-binding protein [bacterium]